MRHGFSLVELSIVLVILGLLVGGVLSGQSLIHAAELRAVTSEYQRYFAAKQSFRDKYFALPGDMTNATSFWGKDNTNCAAQPGTAAANGTCNGDGDGQVESASGANATGEIFQFWKQLALAGLIEGTYTGIAGSGSATDTTAKVNAPASRLSNGTWNYGNYGWPNYMQAHEFMLGTRYAGGAANNPILSGPDSWNIDKKVDDGMPWSGKLQAFPYLALCVDVGGAAPYPYFLNDPTIGCTLLFIDE